MESVRARQTRRQAGVDSVQDFIERRARNIGIYPILTTFSWGYGIKLPEWVWDHDYAQAMIREVSVSSKDLCRKQV